MRIYWFWPYIHDEQLVVPAAVPRSGDSLTLHTLRGRLDPALAATYPIDLRPTLATPSNARERSATWYADRVTAYGQRIVQRRKALRDGHFDVCHIVFSNYFVDGLDFRRIARRTPLVFEVHDVVPHQSRVPKPLERALLRLLYNAPGSIVVRHEVVRDGLVEQFGIDPERITLIPWFVPEVHIEPDDDSRTPTVLFFGTLRRNKGVPALLDAIARLTDLRDVQFVFAGRGFPDVEALVTAAAASDSRIRFTPGYVDAERKHALYSAADLVVLPYTEMPSASAVLSDAYAYQRPVVASDVGGLGFSVRTDQTGWLVSPGMPDQLADAIRAALTDCDGRLAASRNAARVAAERTPARTANRLRALYDGLKEG